MKRELPQVIKDVGFDFHWDEKKVWQLELPTEDMAITELTWHFDIPFLKTSPEAFYDLRPSEIMASPIKYPAEYERTMRADTKYPIDIMDWNQRWVILDGLHRLMKQSLEGKPVVQVRKIPKSQIPIIIKGNTNG